MEKKMRVDGMKCEHCKMTVEKALSAVPGVVKAEVNLEEKTALIQMNTDVDCNLLMDAVKARGFSPVEFV